MAGLPTLYNARTTVVDLSTAMFADSSDGAPISPAGVATSSALSLYQGDQPTFSQGTFALVPIKIDISDCDTFELSFKYNKNGYTGGTNWEGMEVGFILNAGNLADFAPNPLGSTDEAGVGGVLAVRYPMHNGTDCQWQLISDMPPRTEFPDGINFEGTDFALYNFDDPGVCLTTGAYDGTSTLTLRAQIQKAVVTADDAAANAIPPGGVGQTVTALATWIAENGVVWCAPSDGNPSLFKFLNANADNTGAYDILASPYLPLTLTPWFRRLTYDDTAGHPQTVSEMSITVGSSVRPVFWTDFINCSEQL